MTISLNQTIVHARDAEATARFHTELPGLPPHRRLDDGRGIHFDDLNENGLEIITRSCGSGGRDALHPNPLLGG